VPPSTPTDLAGRRVLLGVCGGIAAYKAAEVLRRLRERGADVRVAMTTAARAFVQPLTFEVLSGAPVWGEDYFSALGRGTEEHLVAAAWAELVVVVPATTNTLARIALGLGDDFLSTTLLAFEGPVVLAPAMHSAMWRRESTQEHVATLRRRGVELIGPIEGPLASGEVGIGRLADPLEIVEVAVGRLRDLGAWKGRRVLVTAGPTWEPIDPARVIANRSSGKMGFAIAATAAAQGAEVTLVAGPVALPTPPRVRRVDVETAAEMRDAVAAVAANQHLIVMAAAVADFRVAGARRHKIKKHEGLPRLELELNPDILQELPHLAPGAVIVGFAAETNDGEAAARDKLERKGVDAIVLNDVARTDIGFGADANEVVVFSRGRAAVSLERAPKAEIARALLELFCELVEAREVRDE
jgi:phosphopantothenoylcysteine decarboxylase/phosphopantothenate--cysteine ligase